MNEPERMVEVGRVGRAHGLDGSFYVSRPLTALIAAAGTLTVAGQQRPIERRAGTAQRPILRLAGMQGRADAEALRGQPLLAAVEQLPALGSDEYWAHELEGCAVYGQGRQIGTVRRLVQLPSCETLEVHLSDGGELLVPMVRDAIEAIDVAGRRIDINLAFLGQP